MPKKPASTSRKKFLAKVRKSLEDMKEKILGEMNSAMRAEREGSKDEGMDTYDLASEERDREISFILSDRERAKMGAIEDALQRIAEGSYGGGESCGRQIGEVRLGPRPLPRACRDCSQYHGPESRRARRGNIGG